MNSRAEPTEGDDIFIVREKSKLHRYHTKVEPHTFFPWQRFISNARVVPFPAELPKGSERFVWLKKERGRDAIRVALRVDCGITLKHKGKEWREETSLELIVPFAEFQKLILKGTKILNRHGRKRLLGALGR